ncbi:class I SAM-dependent RNA methyltransferase [Acidisoma sp. C75]
MALAADPPRLTARIETMGADADGIARLADGRPLFLPFTLPGETVEARPLGRRGSGLAGLAETILEPSAERAAPACPHFGACGGCTLQHWQNDAIGRWKVGLLAAALAEAGFAHPPPGPLSTSPAGTRRRIDLAIRKQAGIVALGFHRLRSDEIVTIGLCPVTAPRLVALLGPLASLLPRIQGLKRDASCAINLLDTGPDLLLRTDGVLTPGDRRLLAAFAESEGIARIAWAEGDGPIEIAAQLSEPRIALGGVAVSVPPGAFLQATAEGEAAIVAAVLAALPAKLRPKDRIIELHAGCGTLTFPLAARARVAAFEGDGPAVLALQKAAAAAGLHGRIIAERRDLIRRPLGPPELAEAACILLDPPFAGAGPQIEAIAASAATHVIYVSCNPQALARDAAVLRRAGFALASAQPIDQFLWSARLESVVCFTRPAPPRSRARPPR